MKQTALFANRKQNKHFDALFFTIPGNRTQATLLPIPASETFKSAEQYAAYAAAFNLKDEIIKQIRVDALAAEKEKENNVVS
ncbi:MAG: hypothetical protein LBV47_08090 [Bacteroidales bacterium]|jgi:hypothetical protein|nr:hypothetical protein [Bacteroidales bacterium]